MTDRNIVDLAHAVLDAVVPDVPWKIQLQEFQARAAAAPDLARVATDLTAQLDAERFAHANTAVKVKRVEELAERLEREAEMERKKLNRDPHDYGWDDACAVAAYRIRRALNGDDQ